METEDFWVIINWESIDIISINFHFAVRWAIVDTRCSVFVTFFQTFRLTIFTKYGHKAPSVLVISYSASVVDMTGYEKQGVPWNLIRRVKEQLKHCESCFKVRVVEFISDVPSKWSELSSFLDTGMEE